MGYLRTVLVAYYFGASAQVDAFVVAMLIPAMVLGIISGGMQAVIIPVYTEKKKEDVEKARLFVNQVFFINLILLGFLSLFMILFPALFVKLVAYGFHEQRLSLAAYFLRYLVIFGFLNVFVGFFVGLLQSEKQFLFPAVTLLIGNSLIPASILLFARRIGINSWTIGEISFGAFAFSVLFLFLFFEKKLFHAFQVFHIKWREILQFFALLLPVFFTSGVNVIYQIVDKSVASSLPSGSVAALNFAQLIYRIPYGLLAVPIATSVYPTLSSLAAEKEYLKYTEVIKKTFSLLSFIALPISLFFIVYSNVIVNLLYRHGAFTEHAASLTAFAVSMYSIGLIAFSLNFFFQRVFFSFKDTKTPLYITIFTVLLNAVGDVLLSKVWGVGGIGLATSISAIMSLFLYLLFIRKKRFVENFPYRFLVKEFLKLTIVLIVSLLTALLFKPLFNKPMSLLLSLSIFSFVFVVFIGVVIFCAYFLKSYGLQILFTYIKGVFVKK